MVLRRLLGIIALLSVLAHAVAVPRLNAIALAGAVSAAAERAALASFGVSLPAGEGSAAQAEHVCPEFMAKAVAAVLVERVALREMRLGQTNFFRERARATLHLSTCG